MVERINTALHIQHPPHLYYFKTLCLKYIKLMEACITSIWTVTSVCWLVGRCVCYESLQGRREIIGALSYSLMYVIRIASQNNVQIKVKFIINLNKSNINSLPSFLNIRIIWIYIISNIMYILIEDDLFNKTYPYHCKQGRISYSGGRGALGQHAPFIVADWERRTI